MSSVENTPYISLANKYRPQKFEDMIGQESISKTLQNALKSGRLAHAYLFYGPRGCGKTTTARILAKALNCTGHGENKPTAEPCGQCPQCREIAQSADMDVLELDAASNTQVDKVREAIIDTVALASSRDRFKVFILDEVHMLSASSFNALLKTIEEPPAHVVFILATTEKHKVPATIVSRCQTFRFRPLTQEEISAHLVKLAQTENIDLNPAAARLIAKNAGGAMRDALTLLDRAIAYCGTCVDEMSVRDMLGLTPDELIAQAIGALVHKETAALHQVFQTLQAEGFDANSFLKDLKIALGEAFYFVLGQGGEPFEGARQLLEGVSPGFLAQVSRKVNRIIEEVKFSDNALISAEVGMFTVMDSCLDIESLVRRLEALERGETVVPPTASVPPQAQRTPAATKKETPKKSTTAAVATPAPAPKNKVEESTLPAALSGRQVWEKMLKHFEKSPFVYDVMMNSTVTFNGSAWTLLLPPEKDFYKVLAQSKLAELEAAAKQFGGNHVKITVEVQGVTDVSPSKQEQPPQAAPAPMEIISEEEPLTQETFSAEESVLSDGPVPEEVQRVLDVIPGQLVA